MASRIALMPRLYVSYSQFFVRDAGVGIPRNPWTEKHSAQGFVRANESTVYFVALLEYGYADLAYELGPLVPDGPYQRVIAVPFTVATGTVVVDGPEERSTTRFAEIPNGNYRLVAAQRAIGDDEEVIDLFFEKLAEPLLQSSVIVADRQLEVPATLLETADVA
jgi:hypothetical protein